jgi:hypothetical protein
VVDLRRQPIVGRIARAARRVAKQAIVFPAAEELVDRNTVPFATKIPERGVDPRQHGRTEADPAPVVPALVHPPPERWQVVHGLAEQDRAVELDELWNDLGAEIARVGLSEPRQLRVGQDLDEGGAAPPAAFPDVGVVAVRTGQEHGPDVGDSHGALRSAPGLNTNRRHPACREAVIPA